MPTVAHFVRSVRPTDLKRHLQQLNADVSDWPEPFSVDGALNIIAQLEGSQRDRLTVDMERVCGMADEIGQAALVTLVDLRDEVSKIEGAHARAHWVFLQSAKAFRRAEEVRFAEENQNAQRLWDAFLGPADASLRGTDADLKTFEERLKTTLSRDRIYIDRFERQRVGAPEQGIVHLAIYSEDLPEDDVVFDEMTIRNSARKPVRETAVVYEPDGGTIEVVGRQRKARREVAELFAEVLLGAKLSGERIKPRRFDLTPLLESGTFPLQPQDGIAKVKVTRLTLSTPDDQLVQTFQVPFEDDSTLYERVQEQYGESNPLDGDLHPWSARIEVQFEPPPDAKRGKRINFTITAPNKCSLRGKTERERQILSSHLKAWGLDCGVED